MPVLTPQPLCPHPYTHAHSHAFGHPFEKGPRIFFSGTTKNYKDYNPFFQNSIDVSCKQSNATHFDEVAFADPTFTDFANNGWKHIALSYNATAYHVTIDGQYHRDCTADSGGLTSLEVNENFHVGIYDHVDSGNSNAFQGSIDEIRLYNKYMSVEEIREAMWQELPENPTDVVLYINFNGEVIEDRSGNDNVISTGLGLVARSPSVIPSTAPVAGSAVRGSAIQNPLTADAYNGQHNITITADALGPDVVDASNFDISLSDVNFTAGMGSIIDADGASVTISTSMSISGTTFTYIPFQGVSGSPLLTANLTLSNGTYTTDPVEITLSVTANTAPVAGGAGHAISCDGVNDFLFSSDFEWPVRDFDTPDGIKSGGSPITVEFWGYMTAESELDSAIFAVGANQEHQDSWVDGFNPYAKAGRLIARTPFSGGGADWMVGSYSSLNTNIRHLYNRWNHFSFVHDQANGTTMAIYINGEEVSSGTHGYVAVGQQSRDSVIPLPTEVHGLMVCSWSFWSEVYHMGLVDEFRIWNTSRTQEQIQASMYSTLQGDEEYLYGYWNFDDLSPIDEPRAGGDMYKAKDLTSNGNDLEFGGCAPCEDVYKAWMPYSDSNGVLAPEDPADADPGGNGYRVCLPSAKGSSSFNFRRSETFGGVHCYGNNIDPTTRPLRILSTAPIGGHEFVQVIKFNVRTVIPLNGTDPNGDDIWFHITELPTRGTLAYSENGGATLVNITAAGILPSGVTKVYFTPPINGGGAPLATFSYVVTDGFLASPPSTVSLYVQCSEGRYIDQAAGQCLFCAAGSYSTSPSLETSCALCPINTFQSDEGATKCLSCSYGENYADVGATECISCASDRAVASTLASDSTGCSLVTTMEPADDYVITLGNDESLQYSLVSLPRYGNVFQVVEQPDGSLVKGDPLFDAFVTSFRPEGMDATFANSTSTARPDNPISSILGSKDVYLYEESTKAWSPVARSDGLEDQIVLGYPKSVHVHSVDVHESLNPGAVTKIEAFNYDDQTWYSLWSGSVQLQSVDLALRTFSPTLCPTFFATDLIRLSLDTGSSSGAVQIDAVTLNGVASVAAYDNLYVTDPKNRLFYEAGSIHNGPTEYADSFSYVAMNCMGNSAAASGETTLDVQLAPTTETLSVSMAASLMFFSTVGVVISLLCLVLVIVNMDQPIIKASSAPFNVINAIAIALLFLSVTLYNSFHLKPEESGAFCQSFPFMLGFSFSVMFGSSFIKLWRINRIFNSKVFKQKPMSTTLLMGTVMAVYAVDLFTNFLWMATDPLEKRKIADGEVQVYECHSDNMDVWYSIHYATKGFLMVLTILYCFKTKNVPSMFNETKGVGFVAYNAAFFTVLSVVILRLVQGNIKATVVIVNFGIQTVGFIALVMFFFTKFFVIYFDPESQNMGNTTQMTQNNTTKFTSNKVGASIYSSKGHSDIGVTRHNSISASGTVPSTSGLQSANKAGSP